jgi:hypothetical protein
MTPERKDRIRKLVKEIQDIEDAKNELCRRKRAVSQQAKAELGYGDSDFDAIEEVLLALWGPVSTVEPELLDSPGKDRWDDVQFKAVVSVIPEEFLSADEQRNELVRGALAAERSFATELAPVQRAVYETLKSHGPLDFHTLENLLPNIGFGVSSGLSHLSRKGLAVKGEDGIWRAL